MKRIVGLFVLVVCIFLWTKISTISDFISGQISPQPQYTVENAPLDGQPPFPVPVNKQLNYWIVNCAVSDATTKEVDRILENLNADRISQTAMLCIPKTISQPTAYAERFLRYMGLGMPDGDRKNNGFVFLVLQDGKTLDVHYAVGLGLPALTAQGLSPLNRVGEDTFKQTNSLDSAVLAIANGFDSYARSKYQPSSPVKPSYGSVPQQKSEDVPAWLIWLGIGLVGAVILITETLFSFGAVLGSSASFAYMAWPMRTLIYILANMPTTSERRGTSYSSSSSSSSGGGHSGSGGGGSLRGN